MVETSTAMAWRMRGIASRGLGNTVSMARQKALRACSLRTA